MTTLELIQQVQDLISEETYDRFSKAEIMRWLNRGLEDISVKTGYLTWKWKYTLVATKREYSYPTEAKSLYRMEYNDLPLPPSDIPGMDEVAEETGIKWLTASGPPQNWYHAWNRAVGFYPTPDAQYFVYAYGFSKAAVLTDDDSVPLIPDHFHAAPALFAAYQILREDKELITAASLRNEYYKPATRTGIIYDMIKEKRKMNNLAKGRTIKLARWSS